MIDNSVLEKAVFEVRFEKGFLYWDNCGKIWREIISKWPDLKAESISPERAQLSSKKHSFFLRFNANSIDVTQEYPDNTSFFREFTEDSIRIISTYLEVKTFTRVGNRFIYILPIKDSNESIELLKKTGFFNVPVVKLSKLGTSVQEPRIKFIINKDNDISYIFNLAYIKRELELKLPKPIVADTSKFISTGLIIDIDCCTLKPVDLSILNCGELIRTNERNFDFMLTELFK